MVDRKQNLIQSGELYRAVVETCPDGIVVTDLDGTIITANTAAACLHGYDRGDELIDVNLFDLVSWKDRSHMQQTMDDVLTLGQVRHVHHRLLRGDVSFPADVNLSAVRDEEGIPLVVVAVVRDMTERRHLEETLRYQALHDSLTGLPNRLLLYDRLEHALDAARRSATVVSLLMLDLDGFKEVNDRFGHDLGDTLLQQIAARLQSTLRDADTLARLGGDEFALVVQDDVEVALHVAARVQAALIPPIIINQTTLSLGMSVGIARYPMDGNDRATLFRLADVAMYAAKRSKAGCAVYTADLDGILSQV